MDSVFNILNSVDCNAHTEKKNGLTYLSWAWAWAEVKKRYPSANYTIYESPEGNFYWSDGRTAWVKTGVTIEGLEHIEYLPVMDYRNQSIPLDKVTSVDVNKTIQRSLTKACARHGLGLYIYAGEDLPEDAPKVYIPMSEVAYAKFVEAAARGQLTKEGKTSEAEFIARTRAGEAELAKFREDVFNYKVNNNLQ